MNGQLPKFALLENHYPKGSKYSSDDLADLIGGNLEKGLETGPDRYVKNTCVVRVSHALNNSGAPIKNSSKLLTVVWGKSHNFRYGLRVAEFYEYMLEEYGKPALTWTPTTGKLPAVFFSGKKGIILYKVAGWSDATGHVDLWDGSTCSTQCYPANATSISLWTTD